MKVSKIRGLKKMKIDKIKKYIDQNGGATMTPDLNIANLKRGFMISLNGFETKVKRITKKLLKKYQKLAYTHNAYIGAWVDNNIIYLDLSINILDMQQAIFLGLKNKQLAIFDVEQQTSLYL